jgi:acyl-CoA synthetase (AMP-forming)/AMP-acid ligase II
MNASLIERTTSADPFPLLIKNLLRQPLEYAPDQEIVYRDRFRMDYRTFDKRVRKLAAALARLGVKPGDTVAVMDWDSHRYLECFFAVPMMGAVLHTVNVRLSIDQLVYTINHAEDTVILVNDDFIPLLESVQDRFETVETLIRLTDTSTDITTSLSFAGEYEALLISAPEDFCFPDLDENVRATTFYTTGTTGRPKGVYFSHRQLVLHTYGLMSGLCAYRTHASVDSGDVYMPMTPMFHVHGWGMPYLFTLLGAKQIYPGRYEPEALVRLIVNEKVTFSHCVPTIVHMLISCPEAEGVDFSGLKVVVGGSALSRGLCLRALRIGIDVYSAYGMSETCPILTVANLKPHMLRWSEDQQIEIRCRTGLPVPNVILDIVDHEGNPVPHDGASTGEVVVRAPWLTQGYLKDPERSEELWANGVLHTGDIGWIDEEGYLQIVDRLKDVIKTGGEWVSSLALESILSRHEAVDEVAVIGVPDEKWGERPLALVVLRQGFQKVVSEDDLRGVFMLAYENGEIPRYGVPKQISFVEAIAKTSVGKIDKKRLRMEFS